MKFELKTTNENIEKTIRENIFNRNKNIISFLKLLYSIKENTSICLDGDWGTGKTFFVKQCIKTIDIINGDKCDLGKFNEEIQKNFIDMQNRIIPIYYNAWEWDSEDDPLITIMYDIIKEQGINIDTLEENKSFGDRLKEFVTGIQLQGNFMFSNSVEAGVAIQFPKIEKKDLLAKIKISVNIKEKFKEILNMLVEEKTEKIVIFIDELDRCNPKFAVKIIERIKNFIDDDRFIFVFSTNINELQNIITSAYGNNFNGAYYLQKFFDLQVSLSAIDISTYIRYHNVINNGYLPDAVAEDILKYLNFNIRDCNRFFSSIKYIYDYIMESKPDFDTKMYIFIRDVLFVILLCVKFKKYNDYKKIVNGEGENEFLKYMLHSRYALDYMDRFKDYTVSDEDLIRKIYVAMFVDKTDGIYISNGNKITNDMRNDLENLLSFINDNIKLE